MTDQADTIVLRKIARDHNNQETKSGSCLPRTNFRTLIVFLYNILPSC